jgi:glycosyltransferase involved in cell wall biosynthesis
MAQASAAGPARNHPPIASALAISATASYRRPEGPGERIRHGGIVGDWATRVFTLRAKHRRPHAPPDRAFAVAPRNLWGIDMPYQDTWIVVPAFNEASVIGDVITDLRSVFDNVACVDDGSRDDTAAAARRAGAHVVKHPVNLGQGAAIQTGVEYARRQPGAKIFATFDADGQHRVKDVVAMIDRLTADNVDIVIGTRFAQGPPPGMSALKRFVLRTAAVLSRSSRKLGLTDAHNGLRVFNKKVADELNITMNGMSHASEIITLIVENHWHVAEEPVEILYTDYSLSKGQPLLNGVNIVFDGFLRGKMPR